MKLKKKDNTVLFSQLQKAQTFQSRLVGLLRHSGLNDQEALWLTRCNAIHTFFMKFAIDCVFVDSKGRVRKVYHEVRPWKWAGPVWGATDVIEMAAGQARAKNIMEGDIVECGP